MKTRRSPAPNGTGLQQTAAKQVTPESTRAVGLTAAATPPARLDPEGAFIGSLLWLPADRAIAAADLVAVDDLADPRLRVVLQLIRDVAGDGTAPDPVAVLAHARAAGTVTTAHAISRLAELVAELYGDVPTAASVGYYAVSVLDDALRRRCLLLGERIAQAGEASSLAGLIGTVGAETGAVHAAVVRRGRVLASLGLPIDEVA